MTVTSNTGNSQFKVPTENFGPRGALAWARWTPSGSATQTLTESQGISSITRTGAGAYTVNFCMAPLAIIPIGCGPVENDTTVRHAVRVESTSATAGTASLSHKITTFATEGSLVTEGIMLADVSAPSSAYLQAPCAGTITKIYATLQGAITVADSAVTTSIGGVAITGGAMTIAQAGSAAGTKFSATPSAANTVAAGDLITVTTDGGSTTTAGLDVRFVIQATASTPAGSDTVDELYCAFFLRLYN